MIYTNELKAVFPENSLIGWVPSIENIIHLGIPRPPSDQCYIIGSYSQEWFNKKCGSEHVFLVNKDDFIKDWDRKCDGKLLSFYQINSATLEWRTGFSNVISDQKDLINLKADSGEEDEETELKPDVFKYKLIKLNDESIEKNILLNATVEKAFELYQNTCDCGDRYSDNCAHFLSNALIKAGFPMNKSSARCQCGRMIRAKELLNWIRGGFGGIYKVTHRVNHNSISSKYWIVYQELKGQGHILFHKESSKDYSWRGTTDLKDWPVQWHYKIG